jgi:enamine deaminase RidA (YjgF/YER057c/UK114 family)
MLPPRHPPAPPAVQFARELHFSEPGLAAEPLDAPWQRLARRLRAQRASLIGLTIFGRRSARPAIETAMRAALGETDWPILWIEGAPCDRGDFAGVQAFALVGGEVTRVRVDGRVVASRYRLGEAELCWAGAASPPHPGASRGAQADQAFEQLERFLAAAGFAPGDLLRTWCYNHKLLAWYQEFNRVRSARYARTLFRAGAAPASTGISASNPGGSALVLAGLALRPARDPGARLARALPSPLQGPASAYGSLFSRAIELDLGDTRRLLVSGTAAIDPAGATAFPGDIARQVDLTLRVVHSLLDSRCLGWNEVTRAIAYFKNPAFVHVFDKAARALGWTHRPCLELHCDICRADLLFELELDAEA